MKAYIKISCWLLLLVCAACTEEEGKFFSSSDTDIHFSGKVSDTSTRATVTAFESQDSISVFAFKSETGFAGTDPAYASNIKYIYTGSEFISVAEGISYPADGAALSFSAVYPYQASANANFTFSVKQDQSREGNYTGSDLMTAFAPLTQERVPGLKFAHRLSLIVVNLTFEQAPAGTTRLELSDVLSETNVDLAKNTFEGVGTTMQTIRMAANGTNSYKAILPPQKINAGKNLVQITTEAGATYFWRTTEEIVLNSGMQEIIDLTVNMATGEVKRIEKENIVSLVGVWKWLTSVSPTETLTHEKEYYIVEKDGTGYEYEGDKLPFRWSLNENIVTLKRSEPPTETSLEMNIIELTQDRLIVEYMDEDGLWTETLERYNEKALVTTNALTSVPTALQANCLGQYVLVNGGISLREYGICYSSTNQFPTIIDQKIAAASADTDGNYEVVLTDLSAATTYYFRAYVMVNNETIYGDVLSFTTQP